MRPPGALDLVEAYLVITDKTTGATIADLAPAGEAVTLTARTVAGILRSIADDLEAEQPPAKVPTRPKPTTRRRA